MLVALSTLFAASNLAVGYTFSTVAQNQLQAVQMTFFFFLPNFLLSGFAFPFRGMPHWAQVIGEVLPLTHFIRIVRGIMLKGNGFADMQMDVAALVHLHDRRHGASAVALPQDAGLSQHRRNPLCPGRGTRLLSRLLPIFARFPGQMVQEAMMHTLFMFAAFASLPFVSLQPTCGPAASTCDTPSPGASPNAETRLQLRRKRRPMNRGVASMAAALLA